MFGRRRHAAAPPAMPAPQLSDEAVFETVHRALAEFIGTEGSWTVVRRTAGDHDTIFRDVLTHSVATDIVAALREAKDRLTADPDAPAARAAKASQADTPRAETRRDETPRAEQATDELDAPAASAADEEQGAWAPAPITVWADLRKPVTGEVPVTRRDDMVA